VTIFSFVGIRTKLFTKQMRRKKLVSFLSILILFFVVKELTAGEYIGRLSLNPYDRESIFNPYGMGSPYSSSSLFNPYGKYGSPYSPYSWRNPYATNPPKLYDDSGRYRGKLTINPYDYESIFNPYGRYGSPFSQESINNPYGAGSPYRFDSPFNPWGRGWKIIGQ